MLERLKLLDSIFHKYQKVVFFDTETTGLDPKKDQIIELAYIVAEKDGNDTIQVTSTYDGYIQLQDGITLPPKITELTGITMQDLKSGETEQTALNNFWDLLAGNTLLIAHNAHFDISFLQEGLARYGLSLHKTIDYIDTLTIYKDRAPFPHKLSSAIEHYNLTDVENSHRAVDDCYALAEVFLSMIEERDDILQYINIFGFNPKYGISNLVSNVTYIAQPYIYNMTEPVRANEILPLKK